MALTALKRRETTIADTSTSRDEAVAREMEKESNERSKDGINVLRLTSGGAIVGLFVAELATAMSGLVSLPVLANLGGAAIGGGVAFLLAKHKFLA